MSSISSRWRPSSSSTARAISGSAAASGAEKNEFERTDAEAETFIVEPSLESRLGQDGERRGLSTRAQRAKGRPAKGATRVRRAQQQRTARRRASWAR